MTLGWRRTCTLALLGACILHVETVRAQSTLTRAIVQGEASPEDDAVVALLTAERRLGCTGTLIRPHVILTGAHCVDMSNQLPAAVFFGPDLTVAGSAATIVKRLVHPEFSGEVLVADLALLGFEQDVDITPLSIKREAPAVGPLALDVRVVGYGCTDLSNTNTGLGLRRSRQDAITEATKDQKLRHGDSTCRGDSGGPVLVGAKGSERVIGVTSSGGRKDGEAFSLATSVPAFEAWVDQNADALENELLAVTRRKSASGCAVSGPFNNDVSRPLWWLLLILCACGRARMCRLRPVRSHCPTSRRARQTIDNAG